MVYSYKEVLKQYGNDYPLSLAISKNEIIKIEKEYTAIKSDNNKLKLLLEDYIINDNDMWENNYEGIYSRLFDIFENKYFYSSLTDARDNWLELPVEEIIKGILTFFESLIPISV